MGPDVKLVTLRGSREAPIKEASEADSLEKNMKSTHVYAQIIYQKIILNNANLDYLDFLVILIL